MIVFSQKHHGEKSVLAPAEFFGQFEPNDPHNKLPRIDHFIAISDMAA